MGNGYVAINPKFTKLITALRTVVEKGDGTLVRWIRKQLRMMTSSMLSECLCSTGLVTSHFRVVVAVLALAIRVNYLIAV
jgi:hypothetical protein